jgi:hypothetical protein
MECECVGIAGARCMSYVIICPHGQRKSCAGGMRTARQRGHITRTGAEACALLSSENGPPADIRPDEDRIGSVGPAVELFRLPISASVNRLARGDGSHEQNLRGLAAAAPDKKFPLKHGTLTGQPSYRIGREIAI